MAPGGVFNYIYLTAQRIIDELKRDIKLYVQHKAYQVRLLEKCFAMQCQIPTENVDLFHTKTKVGVLQCLMFQRVWQQKASAELSGKSEEVSAAQFMEMVQEYYSKEEQQRDQRI